MTAIVGSLLCCCEDSPCNCSSVSSVTVTWDGSITFEHVPPCSPDGGDQSELLEIFNTISVVCDQVIPSGPDTNCNYVGSDQYVLQYYNCITGEPESTVTLFVQAYVNYFFAGQWSACFHMRLSSGGAFGCSPCSGGPGGFMQQFGQSVDTGDCPPYEAYTSSVSLCEPTGTPGAFISAYTSGDLIVS